VSYASRFRRRQYVTGSLWIVPMLGAVIAFLLAIGVDQVEHSVNLPPSWQFSSSTASTVLAALAAAAVSLIGFVVTVSVLVVQVATANLTPRSMRIWYRDPVLKGVLAVLTGTFSFSFAELRRITPDHVPDLGVLVAAFGMFVGICLFLFFLDRFIHRLRPVKVAEAVGEVAKRTIAGSPVFQDQLSETGREERPAADPSALVRPEVSGVIQAIDEAGLVSWAAGNDCLVALPVAVGDYVTENSVIAEVYGPVIPDAAPRVQGMVAIGLERTIDQDPGCALRLMVDIATRALSAALNDPSTAVQVLAHIGDLLRLIGNSDLSVPAQLRDQGGTVRVLLQGQRWEDYLTLGVTEIREYGGRSIQVVRALRSVLERLHSEARPPNRAAVEEELKRLDATVELHFTASADLDRARLSDAQGIGGPGGDLWLARRA
jgi:uncharacterized membrane protein